MEIFQVLRDIGIFGLAMYCIQLLLTKSADRKFESYKTELEHKTREFQLTLDSKIELYRAELGLQNYKSTQVYERQLNVFINLFEKISELNIEMMAMTSVVKMVSTDVVEVEKEENAAWAKICELYNDLSKYYKKNLIFIPKSTVVKINGLLDEYYNNINICITEKQCGTKTDFAIMTAKVGQIVREKIPQTLDQIIVDFQSLIGVKDQNFKNDK
ncbi:MAG TPA: hypothetical protein PLZ43_04915 [bacterium]|nr:hypothetical protein [bacterium]